MYLGMFRGVSSDIILRLVIFIILAWITVIWIIWRTSPQRTPPERVTSWSSLPQGTSSPCMSTEKRSRYQRKSLRRRNGSKRGSLCCGTKGTLPWMFISGRTISSMGTRLFKVLSASRIIRIPHYVILSSGAVLCHFMEDCHSSMFTIKMPDNIQFSSGQICQVIQHSQSKSTPPYFHTSRCFSCDIKDVIFSFGIPWDGCPSPLIVGASPGLLALLG